MPSLYHYKKLIIHLLFLTKAVLTAFNIKFLIKNFFFPRGSCLRYCVFQVFSCEWGVPLWFRPQLKCESRTRVFVLLCRHFFFFPHWSVKHFQLPNTVLHQRSPCFSSSFMSITGENFRSAIALNVHQPTEYLKSEKTNYFLNSNCIILQKENHIKRILVIISVYHWGPSAGLSVCICECMQSRYDFQSYSRLQWGTFWWW